MKGDSLFFILYTERSGSTFLANLITRNAMVSIPPETNFISEIAKLDKLKSHQIKNVFQLLRMINIVFKDEKFEDWGIGKFQLFSKLVTSLPLNHSQFIEEICEIYQMKNEQEEYLFGIKKGSYTKFSKDLKRLFPECRFLCIIRDGRAVYNSQKNSKHSKTGKPMASNAIDAAKKWCQNVDQIRKIEEKYPFETKVINYEVLIKEKDNY